jgi:glucose-1-phosphate adenylyltransferase
MAFLSAPAPYSLDDSAWPIRTYKTRYGPSQIQQSDIRNSIIGSGCRIRGGTIRNSILSPGVEIAPNARIDGAIILEGARIGRGAKLRRIIVDKFSRIPDHFEIGSSLKKDGANFLISEGGIRVVPKGWSDE